MELRQGGGQAWVMGKVERSKSSEQMSAAAAGLQSCPNTFTQIVILTNNSHVGIQL